MPSSSGAFQNAIMQSPIYLSIVPLHSKTSLVRLVSKILIISVSFSGVSFRASDIVVKPLTSQNMIVIFLLSPPNFSFSGSAIKVSTIAGERY